MRCSSVAFSLGLFGAVLASQPAIGATSTASFAVSATVVSNCKASLPTATAYGSFAITTTNVAITCTLPTPYRVVVRAAVASEASAAVVTKTTGSDGVSSSQQHSLDAHNANKQDLPPATHPEMMVVTVSY